MAKDNRMLDAQLVQEFLLDDPGFLRLGENSRQIHRDFIAHCHAKGP
jgi:hypothetical protein